MTFDDDITLQHLIRYPKDSDKMIHSLAVKKDCSLIEAKNMLKRKAKNFFSKKDYYRYFNGDAEVDEWLFANATSRLDDARAEALTKYPISSTSTCSSLQDQMYALNSAINTSISKQGGKAKQRKYNEVLEIELVKRHEQISVMRRKLNCLEIEDLETEAKDSGFIGNLGRQTDHLKTSRGSGNTSLYLIIGAGIVGVALIAALGSKKSK
tara:strand:+ start:623 stop:1252 length:630 start_codon:yes stop_codon:yes gene_type:complete